jgi:hypothetical protein
MAKSTCNIHRAAHDKENPYLCINRATIQNRDLSFAARGMLAYILSQPDDWKIELSDLQQQCGRDAARNILNELIEAGYIVPGTQKRIKGRFATATPPQCYESPRAEKPSTDNQERSTSKRQPVTENPTEQSNKDKVQKQSKKTLSPPVDDKPKKQRPPDLIFNTIAEIAFNIRDVKKIGATGGRIGKVKKALIASYPSIKPEDLRKFKFWYTNQFPRTPLPRDDKKFLEHYTSFNESFKPADTETPAPRPLNISARAAS